MKRLSCQFRHAGGTPCHVFFGDTCLFANSFDRPRKSFLSRCPRVQRSDGWERQALERDSFDNQSKKPSRVAGTAFTFAGSEGRGTVPPPPQMHDVSWAGGTRSAWNQEGNSSLSSSSRTERARRPLSPSDRDAALKRETSRATINRHRTNMETRQKEGRKM